MMRLCLSRDTWAESGDPTCRARQGEEKSAATTKVAAALAYRTRLLPGTRRPVGLDPGAQRFARRLAIQRSGLHLIPDAAALGA